MPMAMPSPAGAKNSYLVACDFEVAIRFNNSQLDGVVHRRARRFCHSLFIERNFISRRPGHASFHVHHACEMARIVYLPLVHSG